MPARNARWRGSDPVSSRPVSSRRSSRHINSINQSTNPPENERPLFGNYAANPSCTRVGAWEATSRGAHCSQQRDQTHACFLQPFLFFLLVSSPSSRSSTRSEKKGTYPPCLFCGGAWQGRDQSAVERIQFSTQRSGCGRAGCAFSSRLVCSERSRRVRRNGRPKTGSHCCACAE